MKNSFLKHPSEDSRSSRKARRLWITGIGLAALLGGSLLLQPFLPPSGGQEAAEEARNLIETTYVSKAYLSDYLDTTYSPAARDYAFEQLEEPDWNQEALEAVDALSAGQNISESCLQDLLEAAQFESSQIRYAFDRRASFLGFDAFAVKALSSCPYRTEKALTRPTARDYLKEAGFTDSQIRNALQSEAVDWEQSASERARELLQDPLSETLLREQMRTDEFSDKETAGALQVLSPDFTRNCLTCLDREDPEEQASKQTLQQLAKDQKFSDKEIEQAISQRNTDWKYNAVHFARKECSQASSTLSSQELSTRIRNAGFGHEETDFVLKYYDEAASSVDDEDTIREKIRQEEAARKAEEEAQKQQQAAATVPNAQMVWIPRTGSKYHSSASCSNMKNPSQVTLDAAIANHYERCSKCW